MNYTAPEYNVVRAVDVPVPGGFVPQILAPTDSWYWSCEDQFSKPYEAALLADCVKRRLRERTECNKWNTEPGSIRACDRSKWFDYLRQVDQALIESSMARLQQKPKPGTVVLSPAIAKKISKAFATKRAESEELSAAVVVGAVALVSLGAVYMVRRAKRATR